MHVAVVPALRLKTAADPLFIVSGGSRTGRQRFLSERRAGVRPHPARPRPGHRRPARHRALQPAGLRAKPDDSEFVVLDPQKLQAAVRECLAALPGDPRYYTTSIAVRDLDDIAPRSATAR